MQSAVAVPTKRVVWDASAWIAMILDERIPLPSGGIQDRGQMCRTVIAQAERGKLEIWTPALAIVETAAKDGIRRLAEERVRAFFDHEYVFAVSVDTEVADVARGLIQTKLDKSLPWLRPADATYVATAVVGNIDEVHAFDGPLSKLSGQFKTLDGRLITIREPQLSAASAPLFKGNV